VKGGAVLELIMGLAIMSLASVRFNDLTWK
jgi:hypothetical protein